MMKLLGGDVVVNYNKGCRIHQSVHPSASVCVCRTLGQKHCWSDLMNPTLPPLHHAPIPHSGPLSSSTLAHRACVTADIDDTPSMPPSHSLNPPCVGQQLLLSTSHLIHSRQY